MANHGLLNFVWAGSWYLLVSQCLLLLTPPKCFFLSPSRQPVDPVVADTVRQDNDKRCILGSSVPCLPFETQLLQSVILFSELISIAVTATVTVIIFPRINYKTVMW